MAQKKNSSEAKREFEKNLRTRYAGATVRVKGRIVMDKGKIIDESWWKNIVDTAWERKDRYAGVY